MLSTVAVAFVYILLGRLVTTHTAPRQAFLTPLASLMTGLGLWFFWFIGLSGALGASLDVTTYLFGGATLLLLTAMFQTFRSFRTVEHFWSKLVTSMVLVFPLWPLLAGNAPQLAQELLGPANTLRHLGVLGHLPHHNEALLNGLTGLTELPGTWAAAVPVGILAQMPAPGAVALLNLMIMLAAAGSLVQAAGMQVKWSNLLLISTGSLLGLTLFNPFFNPLMVTAAVPDALIAAGLLMLAMPLVSQGALPSGVALVPLAFTAVAVAVQDPRAWPFMLLLAGFWALRVVWLEPRKVTLGHLFGWVSLVTLPLLAVFLWREYVLRAELSLTELPDVTIHPWLGLLATGVAGLTCLGAVYQVIHHPRRLGYRALWLYHSSWFIAAAFVLLAFVLPGHDFGRSLVWGQFLLLLPFWRLWTQWYQGSNWQQLAYKSPWGIGAVLALAVVGLLYSSFPVWQHKPFLAAQHAKAVVRYAEKESFWAPGDQIAVLADHPGPRAALAYDLPMAMATFPAGQAFVQANGNRAMFHSQLWEQGVTHLWINSPDDATRLMFQRDLKPEASYLFALKENSFTLLHAFPHVGYTGAGWQ